MSKEEFEEDVELELPDEDEEIEEEVEETIPVGDFCVGDKAYNVQYNKGRVKLYERATKEPLIRTFVMNGGAMSLDELQTLLAYGLCEVGGVYVPPQNGSKMAGKLIETNGYWKVYEVVIEALRRDCGFLFQGLEQMF